MLIFGAIGYVLNQKTNKQIIGLHQTHDVEFKQYNIPYVCNFNNGLNSFRDIKHMNLTDHTDRKRITLESYPFKVPINFKEYIKSIKNSHYYLGNSLKYELVKESTNNFNLYLDNPLSLIQGFMLALVNIRI